MESQVELSRLMLQSAADTVDANAAAAAKSAAAALASRTAGLAKKKIIRGVKEEQEDEGEAAVLSARREQAFGKVREATAVCCSVLQRVAVSAAMERERG